MKKMTKNQKQNARARARVMLADPLMVTMTPCYLCGIATEATRLPNGKPSDLFPTVDHVIPLDRGGENVLENLAIAHHVCNQAKSNKLLSELDLPFASPSAMRLVVDEMDKAYARAV